MRGDDNQQEGMFSYISPEKRVRDPVRGLARPAQGESGCGRPLEIADRAAFLPERGPQHLASHPEAGRNAPNTQKPRDRPQPCNSRGRSRRPQIAQLKVRVRNFLGVRAANPRSPTPSSVRDAGSGTPVVETVQVPKVITPPVSSAPPALL